MATAPHLDHLHPRRWLRRWPDPTTTTDVGMGVPWTDRAAAWTIPGRTGMRARNAECPELLQPLHDVPERRGMEGMTTAIGGGSDWTMRPAGQARGVSLTKTKATGHYWTDGTTNVQDTGKEKKGGVAAEHGRLRDDEGTLWEQRRPEHETQCEKCLALCPMKLR